MALGCPSRTLLVLALCSIASAQQNTAIPAGMSPQELVRRTIEKEIKANSDVKFMFRDRKQTAHGTETRLVVETQQATAGMVVARNDKCLDPAERQAELDRVRRLVTDPSELAKKSSREKQDAERTTQVLRAFPDAFIYEADGSMPGQSGVGRSGDQLVRLKFHPNPNYVPPGHGEMVLTGLQGYLLIDVNQLRMAKIDGALFRDVDFGWGILGKLRSGGRFVVEQGDEGEGQWEITHMNLDFHGKILMLKSLDIHTDEVFTDFRKVPSNLTFAAGISMLEQQQQAMLAKNSATAVAR